MSKIPERIFSEIVNKFVDSFDLLKYEDVSREHSRIIEHVKDIWREIEYDSNIKVEFVARPGLSGLLEKLVPNLIVIYLRNYDQHRNDPLVIEAHERTLYMMDQLDTTSCIETGTYVKTDGYITNSQVFVYVCKEDNSYYKSSYEDGTIAFYSSLDSDLDSLYLYMKEGFFVNNRFNTFHYMDVFSYSDDEQRYSSSKKVILELTPPTEGNFTIRILP